MTTSTKFNKVAANLISWGIIVVVLVSLYFTFHGMAVHASIR